QLPGYPASHGCIRLPLEFSQLLFTVTGLGTSVIIADQTSTHQAAVQPSLILPNDLSAAAKDASENAASQKGSAKKKGDAGAQPFASVLVSGKDQKAYLIVDGTVTFETPIRVYDEAKPLGTHLYSLVGPSKNGPFLRWNSFDIDGDPQSSTTVDL